MFEGTVAKCSQFLDAMPGQALVLFRSRALNEMLISLFLNNL